MEDSNNDLTNPLITNQGKQSEAPDRASLSVVGATDENSQSSSLVHSSKPRFSPHLFGFLCSAYLFFALSLHYSNGKVEKWKRLGVPDEFILKVERMNRFNLTAALVLLLTLILALPQRYELYSDATLVVRCFFCKLRFIDIRSALRNSSYCETIKRIRWDFATDFQNRVIIKRGDRRWEVTCSPEDPDAFVQAVSSLQSQADDAPAAEHIV